MIKADGGSAAREIERDSPDIFCVADKRVQSLLMKKKSPTTGQNFGLQVVKMPTLYKRSRTSYLSLLYT